jgi:hypothetical protein
VDPYVAFIVLKFLVICLLAFVGGFMGWLDD